jgi:hypothetical protein
VLAVSRRRFNEDSARSALQKALTQRKASTLWLAMLQARSVNACIVHRFAAGIEGISIGMHICAAKLDPARMAPQAIPIIPVAWAI